VKNNWTKARKQGQRRQCFRRQCFNFLAKILSKENMFRTKLLPDKILSGQFPKWSH